METRQSLWANCTSVQTAPEEKHFKCNYIYFNIYLMPLILNPWGKPGTALNMPILQVLTQTGKFSLWAFFSPSWAVPRPLSMSSCRGILFLLSSLWLLDWFQNVHVSCTGKPGTGHSTPGVTSPVLDRREGWCVLDGSSGSNAAQEVVGCLCCKGTLLAHVHLPALKRNFRSLSEELLSVQLSFSTFLCIALSFAAKKSLSFCLLYSSPSLS